jgi:dipeptidyl aminopeptidase/acylaminoacyl peptidase
MVYGHLTMFDPRGSKPAPIAAMAFAMLAIVVAFAPFAAAELPPLIPRELIFGGKAPKGRPTISPDGKTLAWIAPDSKDVMQIWVQTIGRNDARAVTTDRSNIWVYHWTWDSKTILYEQDFDGDENYHVFALDLASGNIRDLTPWRGVREEIVAANPKFPDQILVAMNLRDRKTMDVYRVDLKSGAVKLDTSNPGDVAQWLADDDMVVRGAGAFTPEGGIEIRVRDHEQAKWRVLLKTDPGDSTEDNPGLIEFSKDGRAIAFKSSAGSDTAQLVSRNLATGAETVLARRDDSDLGDTLVDPVSHTIEAASFSPDRKQWKVIDPSVQPDFDALAKVDDGDLSIESGDSANQEWLVKFVSDRHTARYYLWDRPMRKVTFLFSEQPRLDAMTFAPMKPITFRARDGMNIHAFLTLPVGLEGKNLPLVEFVHGGPWWNFSWGADGINYYAQWFANRGYAVLQVNYRGSTGYGKKYLHAGDRQWGRAMQDDLTDSVKWAVAQGIADPKRVAIDGISYGGYAALAGAAFTPDIYICSVDVCGPSNLSTTLKSFPAYFGIYRIFVARVSDPDNPAGKELLRKASPLFSADKIRIPMLIGQGANDPRVVRSESEQIVAAIEKNHGQVIYVIYTDEGHGFDRLPNRLDFAAREEKFLADHLGGRYELMTTERMPGSTAMVKVIGN